MYWKYRIRVRLFGKRVKNFPCEAMIESAARREYSEMKKNLATHGGGYIALFELKNKDPLKAERVGNPPAPALKKEAAGANEPVRTEQKERMQTR